MFQQVIDTIVSLITGVFSMDQMTLIIVLAAAALVGFLMKGFGQLVQLTVIALLLAGIAMIGKGIYDGGAWDQVTNDKVNELVNTSAGEFLAVAIVIAVVISAVYLIKSALTRG